MLETVPFIKPSYFEDAIWKLPSEKLLIPLAQGLRSRCCAQKAIPPLPSLLPLPLPHADSCRSREALNISSLVPTEPRPASGRVSLQHSSAPGPLSQGRRMLSISARSRLAERLQTWLPITRRISQINSRTARQPVGSQGRDRSVLQPREEGQSSSPDAASLLLSRTHALQDGEDAGAGDTGSSAVRDICLHRAPIQTAAAASGGHLVASCWLSFIPNHRRARGAQEGSSPVTRKKEISERIERVQQIMRSPWIRQRNSCKELC